MGRIRWQSSNMGKGKTMKNIYALLIILVSCSLLSFSFFILGGEVERNGSPFQKTVFDDTSSDCLNLSFDASVNCLIKEVKQFYLYNKSNSKLFWNNGRRNVKDWNMIKEGGGVCWHFAEYYVMRAKQINLSADYVEFRHNGYDHAFAVISNNKDEYCIVDQTTLVGCAKSAVNDENI